MENASFTFAPISPADANQLRSQPDPQTFTVDEFPGFPCRQCLRDVEVGEEVVLVSHDPFVVDTPYRSASPIFLHSDDCGELETSHDVPAQLTRRQLSARAFDADGMMIDAKATPGAELAAVAAQMLADEQCVEVHVHNIPRGCWAVRLLRA